MSLDFNDHELKQPWAIKVRDWLDAEVGKLRQDNDNPKLDATQTAAVRGKIEMGKRLRALLTERTQQPRIDPE